MSSVQWHVSESDEDCRQCAPVLGSLRNARSKGEGEERRRTEEERGEEERGGEGMQEGGRTPTW